MKHSPTPWKWSYDYAKFLDADDGFPIWVSGYDGEMDTSEDDKAFVLRAVNTYDQIASLVKLGILSGSIDEKVETLHAIHELLFPSEPIALETEEL